MKKRLLVLVLALFAGLFLVACDEKEKPVEEEKELTLFHIFFNDNVTIDFGSEFNVLNGVTAVGDDYKDYSDKVTYTSTATISATHMLDTTVSGVVTINYRVSVGTIVATKTRTITVRDEAYVEPEPEWKGYAVEVEAGDGQVTITYENTPDQWWNNNAQLAVKDFDGTKNSVKFTFTGVATHTYLFKIEGGGVAKETPIVADGTEQTVTLDLTLMTEAQRDGLNLIVVFVQTVGASGSVIVKDWTYGDTLVVEEPEWTGYNFTVEQNETQATFTYPATPTEWWSNNAQLPVVGFDGKKESVVFTFTGVADHEYLFKVEGVPSSVNKEQAIIGTGSEQTLTLDLSSWTEAQRSSIKLIVVFVKTVGASGSVTVKPWQYGVPVVVEEWVGYNFTVVETETEATLTYPATPANWWENNAQLPIIGFDGTKNSVKFTFTGVANHEYLFKIEGVPNSVNKEQAIIGTGSEQTVTLDLSLMTEAQRNSLSLIIVFVKTKDAAGSLVVKTWEYGAFIQPTEPQWQTSGAVTATKEGTTVTITYTNTPTEWWNNHAKLQVVDFDQTKTKVVFTFTGVAGQEYKFKVEGPGVAKEEAVTATGESQVFTFDISSLSEAQRDAINLLVVFNTVVGASGTIVITNIQFAN